MTAKVVAAVVNLLLYNRNTLYTYNFYSYIFDRCYQLLPLLSTVVSIIAGWPHDSMTAATAELGLEVSQALVTLVSVFGYGRLSFPSRTHLLNHRPMVITRGVGVTILQRGWAKFYRNHLVFFSPLHYWQGPCRPWKYNLCGDTTKNLTLITDP